MKKILALAANNTKKDDIVQLMESGIPAGEAVLPKTNPQQVIQFGSLFS